MEEVRGDIVEDRVEVAKRNIRQSIERYTLIGSESGVKRKLVSRESLEQRYFVDFILALYSLSAYEFYENLEFVFKRFAENLPDFRFFEVIINRLFEAFRVFRSQVTSRIRYRELLGMRKNIFLKMVNYILSHTRIKVIVDENGYHDRVCTDNRQKVGNMCLKFILNQYVFQRMSIVSGTLGAGMFLFKTMMIGCFQNADVNPIFEYILENKPHLLTNNWSLESFPVLKKVFFPKVATDSEEFEVSKIYEISGVAILIYLDQHLPRRSSVSVTEMLLRHGLVNGNTRDPHGFHVIFGPLFRTISIYVFCLQRGQWRDMEDEEETGKFLFGMIPFLNARPFGVVDELILREKFRLFMLYSIECFFVVTEKPSDPESKYFVRYNNNPEDGTVHQSRMMTYLAKHQISMYELIRKVEKCYFDDFFDQPDPDLSLLEDYVLWMWDEKKRASLRIWRFFRTIRTHLLFERMLCHANFPNFCQMWRSGNTPEKHEECPDRLFMEKMKEGKARIRHRDRPAFVNEDTYYKQHYGDLDVRQRKEKALSVLLAFFQMIFMSARTVDYRTDDVSIYRPWHPVGTEEDGGVLHDMEEDGGVFHDMEEDGGVIHDTESDES